MKKTTSSPKTSRGRPKADKHRKVADDIFAAAKKCIESKSIAEVTLREIAAAAGTDQATIGYYYGSRENLLLEIVDEATKEILAGLHELSGRISASPENATEEFLTCLLSFVASHKPAAKIFFSEIIRNDDSNVGRFYNDRWSSMWTRGLGEVIEAAMKSGVYRKDIDPERIAFLFKGISIYTLLKPQVNEVSFLFGNFDDKGWIELLAQIMDSYLRPAPAATSRPARKKSARSR